MKIKNLLLSILDKLLVLTRDLKIIKQEIEEIKNKEICQKTNISQKEKR